MEIERKFLLDKKPDFIKDIKPIKIKQGFLSFNPYVRIRQANEEFFMTIKSGGGRDRSEKEFPISKRTFKELSKQIEDDFLYKKRYPFPIDNELTAEIDIYTRIKNLMRIEVEFKSGEDAEKFIPPDWFGKEITNEKGYSNKDLIKMQIKERKK